MHIALFPGKVTFSTEDTAGVSARLHRNSISETVTVDGSDVESRPEKTKRGVC